MTEAVSLALVKLLEEVTGLIKDVRALVQSQAFDPKRRT